ncbi:hypothetical protein [Halopiger xanaduensis]|uniref:Uncharacterized protein n=1 Tax=Halopiger xanaduensis (strain DSM 18323 / JCM 14033 / SH-6) TaxID=797210 RepID=F8DDQ9_HALXS|nr:hypothetical protein [Halopiger xanaduensis]AEH39161.1 hypothetical protein Halxa_0569 [Halopiger xanaduensis SH-6]
MVSRRSALLLTVLLAAAVAIAGVGVAMGTPEPVLTLENDDTASYHVTAYTVDDRDEAGYLNFEVTTRDGDRRLVSYADLVWPDGYRNVTLVDDGVNRQAFVVGPNETTTEPVEGWTRGDVTVYVIERGDERTHEWSRTVTCGGRGQEHELRFDDDSGGGGSTVCAGGVGWLFR